MSRGERSRSGRSRGKSSPNNTTVIIVLIIVGAVLAGLLVCCGFGAIIVVQRTGGPGGGLLGPSVDLSEANLAKVNHSMSLAQVEAILGPSRKATASDLAAVNRKIERWGQSTEEFKPGTTKYVWRSGTTWYFIDIDDRTQKIVSTRSWSST